MNDLQLFYKAVGLYVAIASVSFILAAICFAMQMGTIQFLFVIISTLISLSMNCLVLFYLDRRGLLKEETRTL